MDLQQRPERRPERRESQQVGEAGAAQHDDQRDAPPQSAAQTPSVSALATFEGVAENFEMPRAAFAFARELVVQVVDHCAGLDAIVSRHAKNWRVARMAVVDRNILRLATFELAHTKTPAAVILNEAVELARRFGSDESPPFVNGVLDAVAREVRAGESP